MAHSALGGSPKAPELLVLGVHGIREYAIFSVDTEGIVTSWNAGVENLLGYKEQEWIGQHTGIMFTPADQADDVCNAELQAARLNGSASDVRWHRRKDGTEFFANGTLSSVWDDKGNLLGYCKVITDETARKHLQDALT